MKILLFIPLLFACAQTKENRELNNLINKAPKNDYSISVRGQLATTYHLTGVCKYSVYDKENLIIINRDKWENNPHKRERMVNELVSLCTNSYPNTTSTYFEIPYF